MSHRLNCRLVAPGALLLLTLSSRPAAAEGWMLDGILAIGTGLEGGDPGDGDLSWGRARTRLIVGFDLRSDEAEQEALGFRAFSELEQRVGVGGEVRYTRFLKRAIGGSVFVSAVVAPETLVGAGLAVPLILPLGPRFGISLEPAFAAYPLGSDLPNDSVLLWATVSLGVRLGL